MFTNVVSTRNVGAGISVFGSNTLEFNDAQLWQNTNGIEIFEDPTDTSNLILNAFRSSNNDENGLYIEEEITLENAIVSNNAESGIYISSSSIC